MVGMKGVFCKWYVLILPQQHPPGKHVPQNVGVLHKDLQSPKLNSHQRSERDKHHQLCVVGWVRGSVRGPGKDQGEGEPGKGKSTK